MDKQQTLKKGDKVLFLAYFVGYASLQMGHVSEVNGNKVDITYDNGFGYKSTTRHITKVEKA